LKLRIDALLDPDEDRVVPAIQHGHEGGSQITIGLTQLKPPPLDLSVRACEVLYHLRFALDYLGALPPRSAEIPFQGTVPHPASPKALKGCCRETFLAGVPDDGGCTECAMPGQPAARADGRRVVGAPERALKREGP
jgi:hypothetical protein